jgi:hypothetical protein
MLWEIYSSYFETYYPDCNVALHRIFTESLEVNV